MQKQQQSWPNYLRALACIGVILLHVSLNARNNYLVLDLLYGGWARTAVPIFVLLTGALVLPKQIVLIPFLKKSFTRIVLPFAFWSLVYIFFEFGYYRIALHITSVSQAVSWGANAFYTGSVSFHFWYIYTIIGLYLVIPVISKWLHNASQSEVQYFLLIWVITLLISTPFNLVYFTGFIGYLIAGYYLVTWPPKWPTWVYGLTFVCAWLVTCGGTYYYSMHGHAFYSKLYDYLTVNVALMAAAIFVLFSQSHFKAPAFFVSGVNFISKNSYGIYLVHVLVLHVLERRLNIQWNMLNPALGIPATTLICLSASALIITGVNRIPVIGKYISG